MGHRGQQTPAVQRLSELALEAGILALDRGGHTSAHEEMQELLQEKRKYSHEPSEAAPLPDRRPEPLDQ